MSRNDDYYEQRAKMDPEDRGARDLLDDYRVQADVRPSDALDGWPSRSHALTQVRRYFPTASI